MHKRKCSVTSIPLEGCKFNKLLLLLLLLYYIIILYYIYYYIILLLQGLRLQPGHGEPGLQGHGQVGRDGHTQHCQQRQVQLGQVTIDTSYIYILIQPLSGPLPSMPGRSGAWSQAMRSCRTPMV